MISKKHSTLTALLFSSALVLAACGDEDEVTQPVNNETQEQPSETTGNDNASPGGGIDEENIGGDTFGFTDFDLGVDYPDQSDAIDISYEEERDEVAAEYTNQLNDTDLSGNDAMDEIEPVFEGLEIDSETPDDEVITQVTEAFGFDANYESFELEIQFSDGTEKEYEDRPGN